MAWALPALLLLAASGSRAAPNIVILLADDMGWNDIGFHGGEIPTPNLDALAYQGVILNRHYTAPICTPSRAAFFTGKYPSNLGMQGPPPIGAGRPVALPLEEKLLPEYLKEVGYSTHLVGKWHLGSYLQEHLPTNRGFDSHFGYWNGYIGHYDGIHSTRMGGPRGIDFHRGLRPAWNESYGRYITDVLTDEAARVIRDHGSKEDLFLMVAHAAPHTGNPGETLLQDTPRGLGPRRNVIKDPTRKIYADMVKELDDSVGRIVTELNRAGMLSNSIILFLSDNGAPSVDLIYGFGNGGSNWPFRGEKVSPHEGGTRVNALAWSPLFQDTGRVSQQLFHMIDWLPTLLSAAGGRGNKLKRVDGVDQWDSLVSSRLPPRRSYVLVDLNDITQAVIRGPWKLVRNYPRSSRFSSADEYTGASGRGLLPYNATEVWTSEAGVAARRVQKAVTPERAYHQLRKEATVSCSGKKLRHDCNPDHCLYDLEADPCETKDLAATRPDVVGQLQDIAALFAARQRPKINATDDPRADPVCWGNYWTTWLDPVVASRSTCNTPIINFLASIYLRSREWL